MPFEVNNKQCSSCIFGANSPIPKARFQELKGNNRQTQELLGQFGMSNLDKAMIGTNEADEAKALLLDFGIQAMKARGGYTPPQTDIMPSAVWTPPIPIIEWLDDFPSTLEIDAYRNGLLNKLRYQTALNLYFIYGGVILKTKGAITFISPTNTELIELHNLDTVAAYLAFKKARIWQAPKKGEK